MGFIVLGLLFGIGAGALWWGLLSEYRSYKATEKWLMEEVEKSEKETEALIRALKLKKDAHVSKDIQQLVDALDKLNKLNARLDKESGRT